jgi:hypothetical protein
VSAIAAAAGTANVANTGIELSGRSWKSRSSRNFPSKTPAVPFGEQRERGGQRRERVEPPARAQRRHAPVEPELPRRRVPPRPEQIPPVLRDQPEADRREREQRRVVDVHALEPDRGEVRDRQRDADVPLVHADAEDEDAGTEAMPLDAERLPA